MNRLDRYIRNQVLAAMAVVLLVLAGLDLVFTLVDEIGDTDVNYGLWDAVRYVMYVFPRRIYELLPMTVLIGSLVGLGILGSANELVVIQTAGVRVLRIVWSVMKPAMAVMLLGLVLGEYIAPRMELQAELDQSLARGEEVALSRYGYWQRDGNAFMHFNAMDSDGVLHGITIYEFDDSHDLRRLTSADSAVYQAQDQGSYWLLRNGSERNFPQRGSGPESQVTAFSEQPWQVDLSPDLLKVLIIDPDNMSISDQYRYAGRFDSQGLDGRPYLLSFWKKALQPLTTAALVIVAVAFIFGPLRSATMGSKVFTAICFGIFFYLLQTLLSTVSLVYQLPPLLAVTAPILLCMLLGLALIRRAA